ncbi:MAG: prolipoprotein diacylglyceryl transferase [Bacillota bacterium]
MEKWNITFPNLGLNFELGRVAFQSPAVGPIPAISVYWYALIIGTGIILSLILAVRAANKYFISKDLIFDIALFGLIAGIIGARAYYVIFSPDKSVYQSFFDIINIRSGGLAIYGGIIGAMISTYILTKINKVSFLKTFDFLVPYLALGQAIGRWGNFFNQEAFGSKTDLPWAMSSEATRGTVHPTFLYESLLCLALFFFLIWLRRNPHIRGMVLAAYLAVYGIGRALIEELRTDSLMFYNFKVSQILGFALTIIALLGFVYLYKKGVEEKYFPVKAVETDLEATLLPDDEANSESETEIDEVSEKDSE